MSRKRRTKGYRRVESAAQSLTVWVGSPASLVAHTAAFLAAFALGGFRVADWDTVLLVLTTIVSLEAIYLSIFIQMSVNRNTASLREVESDIDEIQEDIEEITEDVEEITEDVGELQEDVEEMTEDEKEEEARERDAKAALDSIQAAMQKLVSDIEKLKGGR